MRFLNISMTNNIAKFLSLFSYIFVCIKLYFYLKIDDEIILNKYSNCFEIINNIWIGTIFLLLILYILAIIINKKNIFPKDITPEKYFFFSFIYFGFVLNFTKYNLMRYYNSLLILWLFFIFIPRITILIIKMFNIKTGNIPNKLSSNIWYIIIPFIILFSGSLYFTIILGIIFGIIGSNINYIKVYNITSENLKYRSKYILGAFFTILFLFLLVIGKSFLVEAKSNLMMNNISELPKIIVILMFIELISLILLIGDAILYKYKK